MGNFPTPSKSVLEVWTSGWHWRERIINFTPSWFTVTMGTGIITELLVNFPYPAQWLRNLGYCFWILNICLFSMFTVFLALHYIWYPYLIKATFEDFSQSNYLGAIPMGFDTIITGIVLYYHHVDSAVWVAYAFFWISTAMTLVVSLAAVFIMFHKQPPHKLEAVTGVWLLSFIPLIVTAATGSTILPYLEYPNNIAVLVVSFLMWSAGQCTCFIVLAVYFWRLMAHNLPARDTIVSAFITIGPLGQGSFAIHSMAIFLANFLKKTNYAPTRSSPPPIARETTLALSEAIHWMGIIIGLFLIGYATFWLVESCSSVLARIPMKFNVGIWGFVFPSGTYALALSALSVDLRNDGLKGWAAACTMFVILLWMLCATGTVYKAFWKGEMFYAPGLEGWIYHDENEEADGNENNNKSEGKGKGKGNGNGNDKPKSESAKQVERMQARKRITNSSGTYTITKPGPDDEELGHGGRKRMPENGHAQAGGHGGSDADHDRIDGGVDRS